MKDIEYPLTHRDFRQDHGSGPESLPHRKRGGVSKKKWCKGKKGVLHSEERVKVVCWSFAKGQMIAMACKNCGRYMSYFYEYK